MHQEEKILADLDVPFKKDILLKLLNISESVFDKYVNLEVLSNDSNVTYKEQLHNFTDYLLNKSSGKKKHDNVLYAKLYQETRILLLKEKLQLLEYKKLREEVLDIEEFVPLIQPFFTAIAEGLIALSRAYPDTKKEIKKMLSTWALLGDKLENLSKEQSRLYIQTEQQDNLSLKKFYGTEKMPEPPTLFRTKARFPSRLSRALRTSFLFVLKQENNRAYNQ